MLAIKLKRTGKKHQASFRIIVSERRSKLNGRYVEDIGWLNPRKKEFNLKKDRAEHWLKNGAQPTDTVHNLLVKSGVISGPKKPKHRKKKVAKTQTDTDKAQAAAADNAATESVPVNNAEAEKPAAETAPAEDNTAAEKPAEAGA